MFRKIVLAVVMCCISAPVFADHFNQRNIITLCNEDTSFDSTCYTYLAAYRDLIGFLMFSTEEERAKLLCLVNPSITTERIARQIAVADETEQSGQIADLLIEEICN